MQAFEIAASNGEVVTITTIHEELSERVGQDLLPKSVYRILKRHGWRKIAPRPAHPGADPARREAFKQTSRPLFRPPEPETPDPSD